MFFAWLNDGLNDIQNDYPLYFQFIFNKCICFLKWKLTCSSKAKFSGFPPHYYYEFLMFLIKKTILSLQSTGGLVFSRKKKLFSVRYVFIIRLWYFGLNESTKSKPLPVVTLPRLHNRVSYLWADLIHLTMPIKEY